MEEWPIRIARIMAWERAKGELLSIKQTYLGHDNKRFEGFTRLCDKFIEDMESEGFQE